jgi:hypothetical protein
MPEQRDLFDKIEAAERKAAKLRRPHRSGRGALRKFD